jgi:uncharacterized tellurite resistance protein B-like protein
VSPGEKNIIKCLVAVAWADSEFQTPEAGVIEGLLCGFDASPEEEREILDYAKVERKLETAPLKELSREERELLLTNAALLTHADGEQTTEEKQLLNSLAELLEISGSDADAIFHSVRGSDLNVG